MIQNTLTSVWNSSNTCSYMPILMAAWEYSGQEIVVVSSPLLPMCVHMYVCVQEAMNRHWKEHRIWNREKGRAVEREISSPCCLYTYLLECRSGSPSHSQSLGEQDCCVCVCVCESVHTHHMNKACVSFVICAYMCVPLVLVCHMHVFSIMGVISEYVCVHPKCLS